ncbi:hypothetical protein ACFQZ4_11885 [Catellatospora coxensis]
MNFIAPAARRTPGGRAVNSAELRTARFTEPTTTAPAQALPNFRRARPSALPLRNGVQRPAPRSRSCATGACGTAA